MTEELDDPGARNLLASATLLRLAYNGSDGFPRVIPIGFYWKGNQIVVCTAATAPKVKALSSRPNVAMTIDAGDTPYGGEVAPGAWARKRRHRRRRSRRVPRGVARSRSYLAIEAVSARAHSSRSDAASRSGSARCGGSK